MAQTHPRKKHPAAVELGRKGGLARAKNQTAAERTAQARKAALARWRPIAQTLDSTLPPAA